MNFQALRTVWTFLTKTPANPGGLPIGYLSIFLIVLAALIAFQLLNQFLPSITELKSILERLNSIYQSLVDLVSKIDILQKSLDLMAKEVNARVEEKKDISSFYLFGKAFCYFLGQLIYYPYIHCIKAGENLFQAIGDSLKMLNQNPKESFFIAATYVTLLSGALMVDLVRSFKNWASNFDFTAWFFQLSKSALKNTWSYLWSCIIPSWGKPAPAPGVVMVVPGDAAAAGDAGAVVASGAAVAARPNQPLVVALPPQVHNDIVGARAKIEEVVQKLDVGVTEAITNLTEATNQHFLVVERNAKNIIDGYNAQHARAVGAIQQLDQTQARFVALTSAAQQHTADAIRESAGKTQGLVSQALDTLECTKIVIDERLASLQKSTEFYEEARFVIAGPSTLASAAEPSSEIQRVEPPTFAAGSSSEIQPAEPLTSAPAPASSSDVASYSFVSSTGDGRNDVGEIILLVEEDLADSSEQSTQNASTSKKKLKIKVKEGWFNFRRYSEPFEEVNTQELQNAPEAQGPNLGASSSSRGSSPLRLEASNNASTSALFGVFAWSRKPGKTFLIPGFFLGFWYFVQHLYQNPSHCMPNESARTGRRERPLLPSKEAADRRIEQRLAERRASMGNSNTQNEPDTSVRREPTSTTNVTSDPGQFAGMESAGRSDNRSDPGLTAGPSRGNASGVSTLNNILEEMGKLSQERIEIEPHQIKKTPFDRPAIISLEQYQRSLKRDEIIRARGLGDSGPSIRPESPKPEIVADFSLSNSTPAPPGELLPWEVPLPMKNPAKLTNNWLLSRADSLFSRRRNQESLNSPAEGPEPIVSSSNGEKDPIQKQEATRPKTEFTEESHVLQGKDPLMRSSVDPTNSTDLLAVPRAKNLLDFVRSDRNSGKAYEDAAKRKIEGLNLEKGKSILREATQPLSVYRYIDYRVTKGLKNIFGEASNAPSPFE